MGVARERSMKGIGSRLDNKIIQSVWFTYTYSCPSIRPGQRDVLPAYSKYPIPPLVSRLSRGQTNSARGTPIRGRPQARSARETMNLLRTEGLIDMS